MFANETERSVNEEELLPASRLVVVVELHLEVRVVDDMAGVSYEDICGGTAPLGDVVGGDARADIPIGEEVVGASLERRLGVHGECHSCRN